MLSWVSSQRNRGNKYNRTQWNDDVLWMDVFYRFYKNTLYVLCMGKKFPTAHRMGMQYEVEKMGLIFDDDDLTNYLMI